MDGIRKLLLLFLLVAFGLPTQAFSPDTWIKGLLGGDRLEPKYNDIEFWDFDDERMRGIRAFFYTLPQERENRLIDQRLHTFMTQYLSSLCSDVITLESFDDVNDRKQTKRKDVELAVVDLINQWKLQNKIQPDAFFDALLKRGVALDVDTIIFLERTAYEQTWRKDKKMLLIGFDLVAFDMDLGQPIYSNRFYSELPWFGDKSSYVKAEQKALLDAADALGKAFQEIAAGINLLHAKEVSEAEAQQRAMMREEKEQEIEEFRLMKNLVEQSLGVVETRQEPAGRIYELVTNLNEIRPLMVSRALPTDQAQARRQYAFALQEGLQAIAAWDAAKKAPLMVNPATPAAASNVQSSSGFFPLGGLEAVDWQSTTLDGGQQTPAKRELLSPYPIGNPFDRKWLIPARSNEAGSIGDATSAN
ncbi:MAG: hypothetical protein P9L94_07300 [Candidatus Hinthialibacter antarcticus]|nr:hypothetical protein [Candidatus Hinthialibacter antarcticus]